MCRPIFEQKRCIACGRTWDKQAVINPSTNRQATLQCRAVRLGGPCNGEGVDNELVNNFGDLCENCRRLSNPRGGGKGGGKGKSGRVSKRSRRRSTTAGASSSGKATG